MTKRLRGKIAIVFGAGSAGPGWGNGKAAAVLFAREGAAVVAVDMNLAAALETVDIITAEGGIARAMAADVTKSSDVANVVNGTVGRWGQIDILHNNVGAPTMGGPIELSEAQWQSAMDVNLKSIFLTCKHVLPHMLDRKRGAIVNVSSIAAVRYVGYPYLSYSAAKAGVNHFTSSLALQYAGSGIRVNAIMPGLMDTPHIYQKISSEYSNAAEMVEARHRACPMGRMGTAWDVAHAAVFLASDESSYVTGVSLPVDGGVSVRSM